MKNSVILIAFISMLWSINAIASENRRNFNIGLSVKQLSLDVYKKGNTDPEGILTANYVVRPTLGVESKITYPSDGGFGYKYIMNFGQFEMTTQEVGNKDVNLNTSANGYFLYAMPVGVYNFKNKNEDSAILIGIGVGIGYLYADGNIILTESIPQVNHNIDISGFTYSLGLLFEHQISSWSYSISLFGPEIDVGGFEYNLFDFGITVRKMFYF